MKQALLALTQRQFMILSGILLQVIYKSECSDDEASLSLPWFAVAFFSTHQSTHLILLWPARWTSKHNSDYFLRYFQLPDFARNHSSQFLRLKLFLRMTFLTFIPSSDAAVNKTKASWENELRISLSHDFSEKALRVNSSSSCASLSLIQFQVVHRIHYSKAKIAKIYPGDADVRCNRCSQTARDLTNIFWSCPKLCNFWQLHFDTILKVVGLNIFQSPHIANFCRLPDELKRMATKVNVIAFTSQTARRRIQSLWKLPLPL